MTCNCLERLKADTGLENFITVPHYADCDVLADLMEKLQEEPQ
jgi:hypothetical protein